MDEVLFKEQQRFSSHIGMWLLVLIAPATIVIEGYFSNWNLSDYLPSVIITALIILFIVPIKLETEIRQDGFYYRFPYFIWKQKKIDWNEAEKVYVRNYSPLMEYGGWGLRGVGKNRAFNIWGKQGIQFELKDGRKILFGTQKPEEAQMALMQVGFKPEVA